jgi:trans-aconitate 2-methyltransferase
MNELYDQWDPAVYVRRRSERERPFGELVDRIGADPSDVKNVVDLGCGPGYLTADLARRYPRASVGGLDSSESMVAEANRLASERLTFSVGDVTAWTPSAETDVLVTNAVLQWVPDHPDVLRGWARALRPGAWLAMQVPGNHDAASHRAVREVSAAPAWRARLARALGPWAVLAPAAYATLLTDVGCRVDAWETTYLHDLPADGEQHPVLGWLEGTTLRPVIAALTADEWAAFCAQLTARLVTDYPVVGGRVWYPFRRVFVVAEKLSPGSP